MSVATRIIHKLALVKVEASGVEYMIVVASAVVVVQFVVNVAGFAATVEIGAIDVIACWFASDVVVVAVVAMTWSCLHLRLHARCYVLQIAYPIFPSFFRPFPLYYHPRTALLVLSWTLLPPFFYSQPH